MQLETPTIPLGTSRNLLLEVPLSVSELARHYRAAKEATAARHYQAIWL